MSTTTTEKESRRLHRIGLSLPVRVEHKINNDTSFNEITRLIDVSAFGAGFNLKHPLKRGRLIFMTMPLARQLRNFDFMEPQYKIWGIVRHCIPVRQKSDESYAIGTAFIGKRPPASYVENPAKLYDITTREGEGFWNVVEAHSNPDDSHLPKADRRHTRYQIPINVLLEVLNDAGNSVNSETTVTENISVGGASVFTSITADVGSFLRVTSEQYNTQLSAIVRGKRQGKDGIPRLHLEFFDRYFPLEGIE
jgi:PilZ domain